MADTDTTLTLTHGNTHSLTATLALTVQMGRLATLPALSLYMPAVESSQSHPKHPSDHSTLLHLLE